MKKVQLLLTFLVISLVLPIVFAAKSPSREEMHITNQSVQVFICKLDFTFSAVEQLSVYSSNLSSILSLLNQDRETLNSLSNSGNFTALREFIKPTFENHLKQIREETLKQRRIFFTNLTKDQRQSLRTNYSSILKSYGECQKSALAVLTQKRLDYLNQVLEDYEKEIKKLSAKNLSTLGLQQVVDSARSTIVTPYENELENLKTVSDYQVIIKRYCIFSGCARVSGTNFHLSAKFELAKLDAIISKLESEGLTDSQNIAQAKEYLKSARFVLTNEVGNDPYMGTEHQRLWDNIKSAYSSLSLARDELGGIKK